MRSIEIKTTHRREVERLKARDAMHLRARQQPVASTLVTGARA